MSDGNKMSKNTIELTCYDKIADKANENELIDNIMKREFFEWLDKKGYDFNFLKNVFDGKKASLIEQNRFNIILRNAKQDLNLDICKMVVYFEEDFTKLRKILAILDGETKFIIKKELSVIYKIAIEENNLKQILR